jgi:hypothetical protein
MAEVTLAQIDGIQYPGKQDRTRKLTSTSANQSCSPEPVQPYCSGIRAPRDRYRSGDETRDVQTPSFASYRRGMKANTKPRPGLVRNLVTLANSAPSLPVIIPPDVIHYVQDGRNPDIYTREFVELTMRNNQKLKGKTEAFAQFRDILAKDLAGAVPELKDDVKRVVESTGGVFDG